MSDTDLHRVANWVISRSLDGASETELLEGICSQLREVGVDVSRAMAIVDTLHPVYEGRAFRTRNDGVEETTVIEYGPTSSGSAADNWRRSAFYHLFTTGAAHVRRRIAHGDPLDFSNLEQVSRIASMCRSVDRPVVLSADFAAATSEQERASLVSVGRFALRGVGRAQELFTIDPALMQRTSS